MTRTGISTLIDQAAPLHGARWICHPDDKEKQKEGERTIYVGVCDLPETADPNQATLTVCA